MDEFVAALFGSFLMTSIGHPVARIALPYLSFGKIYAQPLSSLDDTGFNFLGYRHGSGGRIEIDSAVASVFGFAIFLVVLPSAAIFVSTLF